MIPTDQAISPLPDRIQTWQESLQWHPSPSQQQQFQAIYAAVLRGNQQMNLTRITEATEFWEKHLWDSLSGLSPWLQPDGVITDWASPQSINQVIDIGTGAGFPGLPAAVVHPTWQMTLLDSTQKKIRFLQDVVQTLGFSQVQVIADRAEFLGHHLSHREQYDLALVRAVGSAATCAEYAMPLVKVGGTVVLYRGQWNQDESDRLAIAIAQLGGQMLAVNAWQTPLTRGVRHCIYLQKHTPTDDAFPRPVGIPAKQPLA
ncbi:MAG: 16S rRNA (guanine(527)-N(7))-methyltransferase RsmG [Leptolyngbya sp. SIO1D8]|nr:16S rRNA (guanine(527)-N(7))-methyltransferase RsmG [Leptolyngbya sp. SIO1D8]